MDKQNLRKHFRQARKQARIKLCPTQHHYINYRFFRRHLATKYRIGIYLDAFNEVPTDHLISLLLAYGKKIYIPLVQRSCKTLRYTPYYSSDLKKAKLVSSKLGMSQKKYRHQSPALLDIVILPALAIDVNGVRLGMGGGYYDRTFKHHRQITRVVYIFKEQKCVKLPKDSWDLKAHHIVSV